MLNVTIGCGVSVKIMKEERVTPRKCCEGSWLASGDTVVAEGAGTVDEVRTTTECGTERMRCRICVLIGGSCGSSMGGEKGAADAVE